MAFGRLFTKELQDRPEDFLLINTGSIYSIEVTLCGG
jgi:hypothetical protein